MSVLTNPYRFGTGGNDSFTKLLLHCDGTDAGTTFTDSSASAHTITAGNSAQLDTAQSKFGTASILFTAATNDYVFADGSSDFAFGTGDFTVDLWIRPATTGVQQCLYASEDSGARPLIFLSSTNVLIYYTNGANRITGTTPISTGAWYHVALARAGTSTKLFLGGTQEGSTYSDSTNYTNPASRPIIGNNGATFPTGEPQPFDGWMDEIRVSKGTARWTSNFTPFAVAYS